MTSTVCDLGQVPSPSGSQISHHYSERLGFQTFFFSHYTKKEPSAAGRITEVKSAGSEVSQPWIHRTRATVWKRQDLWGRGATLASFFISSSNSILLNEVRPHSDGRP